MPPQILQRLAGLLPAGNRIALAEAHTDIHPSLKNEVHAATLITADIVKVNTLEGFCALLGSGASPRPQSIQGLLKFLVGDKPAT
jgi:hypothetical protein